MKNWHQKVFKGLYRDVLANIFDGKTNLQQAGIIKRLLKARKGQKILDVPCGQGRLTLALARMGLKMSGVDVTEIYIQRARRAAAGKRNAPDFQVGDMRELPFEEDFDSLFNWFGSFGYFSEKQNKETLK